MSYVVVIFGSDKCRDGLNFEPMEAIGPLTWDESTDLLEQYVAFKPHRLVLRQEQ